MKLDEPIPGRRGRGTRAIEVSRLGRATFPSGTLRADRARWGPWRIVGSFDGRRWRPRDAGGSHSSDFCSATFRVSTPSRKQIIGAHQPISDRPVSAPSFCRHPGKHGNLVVDIVVDDDLSLCVMEAMEPTCILGESSLPGDGHGQKQRVQPCVVEALAEIASGRDQDAFFGLGDCREPRRDIAALLLALAAAQDDHMFCETREASGERFEVVGALGNHDGRTSCIERVQDVIEDERVAALV